MKSLYYGICFVIDVAIVAVVLVVVIVFHN